MDTLRIQELEELYSELQDELGDSLLTALVVANNKGMLGDLLNAIGMSHLISNTEDTNGVGMGKLLVLGDSQITKSLMCDLAEERGFDSSKIEFALEYERLKRFNFGKLRHSTTYSAILADPMPHSTHGKNKSNSFIDEVKNNPDAYPELICIEAGRELKITKNGFTKALDDLELYLDEAVYI